MTCFAFLPQTAQVLVGFALGKYPRGCLRVGFDLILALAAAAPARFDEVSAVHSF